MEVHIIVDMQNDFINGALANPAAQAIVKPICQYLNTEVHENDLIIMTMDTHDGGYLHTQEGKYLPVPHCIYNTTGWQVNEDVKEAAIGAALNNRAFYSFHDKPTFGDAANISNIIRKHCRRYPSGGESIDSITVMGTCTDICVVSNVLGLKAEFPEIPIRVIGSLCAGLTPEKHEAALEVMRSCQVEVK